MVHAFARGRILVRLEVNRRIEAAVQVEGHGFMLMRHLPLAADFAETKRLAKPKA
jgi:hypothetical protein